MKNKTKKQIRFIKDLGKILEDFENHLELQEETADQTVDKVFELVYDYLEKNETK